MCRKGFDEGRHFTRQAWAVLAESTCALMCLVYDHRTVRSGREERSDARFTRPIGGRVRDSLRVGDSCRMHWPNADVWRRSDDRPVRCRIRGKLCRNQSIRSDQARIHRGLPGGQRHVPAKHSRRAATSTAPATSTASLMVADDFAVLMVATRGASSSPGSRADISAGAAGDGRGRVPIRSVGSSVLPQLARAGQAASIGRICGWSLAGSHRVTGA